MITQGVLPYQYREEKREKGMTALGGLPPYLDLAQVVGLTKSIEEHVRVRVGNQGWTNGQVVTSLVLLNLAGGESVEDLKVLEGDEGFCKVLRRVEGAGYRRRERREFERRWRKEKGRSVPSPSSVFRFLSAFHDAAEEKGRLPGKAYIPKRKEALKGLERVNGALLGFAQGREEEELATLDLDATVIESHKREALYTYQGSKGYQPLNVYWAEKGLMLYSEFRDGNVPAGYEQLRVMKEALGFIPKGVKKLRLRSDTAGYEHELLKWCDGEKNKRFGRIEFAVGSDVTAEFKKAVREVPEGEWQRYYEEREGTRLATKREWAEVCFVPSALGKSKQGPTYRYLATRELLSQRTLPGLEEQQTLSFPTVLMKEKSYKVFGIVTNRDLEGGALIRWYYERCGKSEEAHSVLKSDLAGGKLPSGDFGENAAWWQIAILAANLNTIMKRLVLKGDWIKKRMKAIRFAFIHLPGRVYTHARGLFIDLTKGHPSNALIFEARRRIAELAAIPPS